MGFVEDLNNRILIIDGGFGTTVQNKGLSEKDFKLEGYEKAASNDVLVLMRPDIVERIHKEFLQSGADIIITNTFNANAISMEDYNMADLCYKINVEAAKIAKRAALEFSSDGKKYVAGSVGPTNKSASLPSDFMNPSERAVSFLQLKDAYCQQIEGLIDGGCDLILIETVFDGLNAKSALDACNEAFKNKGKKLPIMVSTTVNQGGRLLSGQTLEAFYHSIITPNVISFGINCSFGAEAMEPFIRELAGYCDRYISLYPNAGMPDDKGNYNSTPEQMAQKIKALASEGLVNMVGGCCGTTFLHIEAIANEVKNIKPRTLPPQNERTVFSGVFAKELGKHSKIGKGMNTQKNEQFLNALLNEEYEEALDFGSEDVENGADILQLCVDNPKINIKETMIKMVRLIASRPDISCLPVMLVSKSFEAVEEGLKNAQGRHLVLFSDFSKKQLNRLKEFGCGIAIGGNNQKAYEMLVNDIKMPKRDILILEDL